MLIVGIYMGISLVKFVIHIFSGYMTNILINQQLFTQKNYTKTASLSNVFYGRPFSTFRPLINNCAGWSPRFMLVFQEGIASVLFKVFINSKDICHTTDAPLAHEQKYFFFKCKRIMYDPRESEYNYTMMKYGATSLILV